MTGVSDTEDQDGREGAESCGEDDPGRCPGSPGRREYPGLSSAHSRNGTLRSVAETDLITIVVADDQRLIRDGIRVILDHEPGMRVVGEASDGLEAVGVVARLRPRVVLMDIRMPVLDGIGAIEQIGRLADPPVVVGAVLPSGAGGVALAVAIPVGQAPLSPMLSATMDA